MAYVATLLNAINRCIAFSGPRALPPKQKPGIDAKVPKRSRRVHRSSELGGNYVKGLEMSVGVSSGTANDNVSGHSASVSSAQGVLQSADVDTQSVDEELLRAGGVAGGATQPDCGQEVFMMEMSDTGYRTIYGNDPIIITEGGVGASVFFFRKLRRKLQFVQKKYRFLGLKNLYKTPRISSTVGPANF
ncbi:hypothetical protein B0H10DRAFT_1964459 [Mycena sp. CBHHK59/15]|nr:hypothetical protein B0H10DRAFT_1964459 [Mycena sp. CBHHK59/15]